MSIEIKISRKRFSYKKAMLFLNKRVDEVKLGKNKELIWILEHPTTFTAGVSYNKKDIILFNTVKDAEKFLVKAVGKTVTRVELEDNHGLHIEENIEEDDE